MKYIDISETNLSDYITSDRFRTVMPDCRNVPMGISEIAVLIELKKHSKLKGKKGFPLCFQEENQIYGFLRPDVYLKEKLSEIQDGKKVLLLLNEFDKQRFLLIFRQPDGTEQPMFFVKLNDVAALLETCRNPKL